MSGYVCLGSFSTYRAQTRHFRFALSSRRIAVSRQTTFMATSGLRELQYVSVDAH